MNLYVGQVYIEAGANYPFTHLFQRFIHKKLTESVRPSAMFTQKYGDDYDVIFRMSAKSGIERSEIRGPTVFKRDKDVEYSIFLPFRPHNDDPKTLRGVLITLLTEIGRILSDLGFDTSKISCDSEEWADHIVAEPTMLSDREFLRHEEQQRKERWARWEKRQQQQQHEPDGPG